MEQLKDNGCEVDLTEQPGTSQNQPDAPGEEDSEPQQQTGESETELVATPIRYHDNLTEEQAVQVAQCLEEWGCCTWCILRFLGNQEHVDYQSERSEFITKYQLQGLTTGHYCITCLGILQMENVDQIVEKCREALTKTPREFHSFLVVMKLPVALIPRQHAVLVLLKEKFPEIYENVTSANFLDIKPVWKMIYAKSLGDDLDVPCISKSPCEIRIQFDVTADKECNFLKTVAVSLKRKTKRQQKLTQLDFNQNNVRKALSELPDEVFKHYYQCPPPVLIEPCLCTHVQFYHSSLYLAGRYNKYSREFGQTPWFVEGEQKIETSVQEIITPALLDKIRAADHRFMASGREDVDVRMLGQGRPFMIEFIDPKIIKLSLSDIKNLQDEINKNEFVKIRHLQIVCKEEVAVLKVGEMEKSKNYSALIWCKEPVNPSKLEQIATLEDLKLDQLTPIRVLHRRSHSVREKTVYSMSCKPIDQHHFQLSLCTQAGTYIKEFVHGDFGRTRPNLGEILGSECDILALDVEDVILDWPKPTDDTDISQSS